MNINKRRRSEVSKMYFVRENGFHYILKSKPTFFTLYTDMNCHFTLTPSQRREHVSMWDCPNERIELYYYNVENETDDLPLRFEQFSSWIQYERVQSKNDLEWWNNVITLHPWKKRQNINKLTKFFVLVVLWEFVEIEIDFLIPIFLCFNTLCAIHI